MYENSGFKMEIGDKPVQTIYIEAKCDPLISGDEHDVNCNPLSQG
jgi:hypothetical protein